MSGWSNCRVYKFHPADPARNSADWNDQELEDLARGYLRGDSLDTLANRHQRKVGAIESRLGRIAAKLAPVHLMAATWKEYK